MAKTAADPTGQARNRNRSTKRLSTRLTVAERNVKKLFRDLSRSVRRQTRIVNAEQTAIYDYIFDMEAFEQSLEFIINEQLLETQTGIMPFVWFWKEDVERPYRQGTAEEVRDFNQLIVAAVIAGALVNGLPPQTVSIERVLLSEGYRTALTVEQIANFSSIKTLSERTASQVMQRIVAGIEAGSTPTAIAADISERFDVSRSSARRIAETEVNKAFNDANMQAGELLAAESGLRAAVMHISALLATTRATHAARHGNVYTNADQLQWWAITPNRINCKCTTRSVLIDRKGKVIDTELQQDTRDEGREFFLEVKRGV